MTYTYEDVAGMIDHSLLNPTLTPSDLENGYRLAAAFDVASVCIMPFAVADAANWLSGSRVALGTTIGFPHGVTTTAAKLFEAEEAMRNGAVELDMVINIPAALAGDYASVEAEVKALADLTHSGGARLKVIFENCYQSPEAVAALSEACGRAGADWIKTSTGYGSGGAVDQDLTIMRNHALADVQVKAAGGVRTLERLLEVRVLGCTRIGATRTVSICNDARTALGMEPIEGFADTPAGY